MIFVKFYVYNSYTSDGELYFRTVKRIPQNVCYKRHEKALGDPDPGYFPDKISYHFRFSLLPSSHSGFLFVSSEHADPIPASETLHLLFLPFQSYLPRPCSFSTFEAQLNHPLFKEASLTVLGGQHYAEVQSPCWNPTLPSLAVSLWVRYLIFLCVSFLTCKIGMLTIRTASLDFCEASRKH